MQWVLSFHLIFMVAWFAGLFYLPRLFVYHTESLDSISIARFKIMEHRLYYYITTPAAIVTTILGLWLLAINFSFLINQSWMLTKLVLVAILWVYHLVCGARLKAFEEDQNRYSSTYYRIFNEVPTVLLIGIIIMAIVRP